MKKVFFLIIILCISGFSKNIDYHNEASKKYIENNGDCSKKQDIIDIIDNGLRVNENDLSLLKLRATLNFNCGDLKSAKNDINKIIHIDKESIETRMIDCFIDESIYGKNNKILNCYRNVSILYEDKYGTDFFLNMKNDDINYVLTKLMAEDDKIKDEVVKSLKDLPDKSYIMEMVTTFNRDSFLFKSK